MSWDRGFTILEVLIALFIITAGVTIIVPSGIRLYQQGVEIANKNKWEEIKRKCSYKAFIMDDECVLLEREGKACLICQGKEIEAFPFIEKEEKEKVYFNHKGLIETDVKNND
ncbi:hypothetical protein DRN43_06085 [Thermococci archaeon]|nr:MAG: hypothetical protein DRN43_06085 [Thermococci archaeon]